ncbi:hypothetical protein [Tenacibaculum halocynthiae]|uniref:hypothetical protein n=1 Tax=Tenacibaculum halocynthiae TaxID=1254437 RepID=UPI00389359DB
MKKILFILLLTTFSLEAQITYVGNRAININNTFLDFDMAIIATSYGGNIAVSEKFINNLNKNSLEYYIVKGQLLYNTKGLDIFTKYIDKNIINIDDRIYIKAYVNLLTKNIDDYNYYLKLIKDNMLKTKLKIQYIITYYYNINPKKKKEIIDKIEDLLQSNIPLTDQDKLFLNLSIVDFKDWDSKNEKFSFLLDVYNKFKELINSRLLLEYLNEDCENKKCKEIEKEIAVEKNAYNLIEKILLEEDLLEEKLTNIIERSPKNKLQLKSYIFTYHKRLELSVQLQFFIYGATNHKFSISFVNYLKESLDRDILITNILKGKDILRKKKVPLNEDLLQKQNDEELFALLGIKNHLMLLKKNKEIYMKSSSIRKQATFEEYYNPDSYLTYLKNNPLHNETRFFEIENLKQYQKVLKQLKSFNKYNLYQKQLYFNTLIHNEKYFKSSNFTSKNIINSLIDIFIINQEEGNPEGLDENNRIIHYFLYVDWPIRLASSFSDLSCLKKLTSTLSKYDIKDIIDSLKIKIKTHQNNKNLKSILTLLLSIYEVD